MNILILSNFYYPSCGGIETYLYCLTDILKQTNHIDVITSKFDKKLKKHEKINSIDVYRFKKFKGDFLFPQISQFFASKKINLLTKKKNYDLIIVRSVILADVALKIFGNKIPIIYIAPSIAFREALKRKYPKIINFLYKHITIRIMKKKEKKTLENLEYIVVFSEFMKKELLKYFNIKKIVKIPPGINTNKFKRLSEEDVRKLKEQLSIPQKSILLLSVSRLVKQKNIELIIKTMPKIPNNCYFLIIGDGIQKNNLIKLARKEGVYNRCRFLGFKTNPEYYYGCSDMFINPATYEPFGHVFLEAMSSGLPIIWLDSEEVGGSEILEDGKNGYSINNSTENLANTINKLCNEKVRYDIAQNNLMCSKMFSWEIHAKKLISLIKK